jgi:hypothetical protein
MITENSTTAAIVAKGNAPASDKGRHDCVDADNKSKNNEEVEAEATLNEIVRNDGAL